MMISSRKSNQFFLLSFIFILCAMFVMPQDLNAQRRKGKRDARKEVRKKRQSSRQSSRTSSRTNRPATQRSISAKMPVWTYNSVKVSSGAVTQSQLASGLEDIGSPREEAKKFAKDLFNEFGGWEGVVETASGCTGVDGCIESGAQLLMQGLAIGLGTGIKALVHRVRTENGSNIAIINTVPGAKLTGSSKKTGKFYGRLVKPGSSGDLINVSGAARAVADNSRNKMSAMVLNLTPVEGGRIEGKIPFTLNIPGKGSRQLELYVLNRIGAGIKSTYRLRDVSSNKTVEVSTNRRDQVSTKHLRISGRYGATIQLRHANHSNRGVRDQRKDVLTILLTK